MGGLLVIIILVGAAWLLLLMPARRRRTQHAAMQDSVEAGDEIITAGGLHGTVKEIDEGTARVEIAPNVVVTRGGEGLLWAREGESGQMPAFTADIADSTGAGDAFHGAFAFGLARGMGWVELLRYASAVGAPACTRFGARAGIPDGDAGRFFLVPRCTGPFTARPFWSRASTHSLLRRQGPRLELCRESWSVPARADRPRGPLRRGRSAMREVAILSPRFAAIIEQARRHSPLPVAVVDAQEAHVLAGVVEASDYGLIEPLLLGPRAQIEDVCKQLGCPGDRFPIHDAAVASASAVVGRVKA